MSLSFEHGSWAEWLRAVPDTPPPLLNYYLCINACKGKMFVASNLAPYEAVKRLSSIPRNRSIPRFRNGMLHVRHVDRAARQNYISVLKIRLGPMTPYGGYIRTPYTNDMLLATCHSVCEHVS